MRRWDFLRRRREAWRPSPCGLGRRRSSGGSRPRGAPISSCCGGAGVGGLFRRAPTAGQRTGRASVRAPRSLRAGEAAGDRLWAAAAAAAQASADCPAGRRLPGSARRAPVRAPRSLRAGEAAWGRLWAAAAAAAQASADCSAGRRRPGSARGARRGARRGASAPARQPGTAFARAWRRRITGCLRAACGQGDTLGTTPANGEVSVRRATISLHGVTCARAGARVRRCKSKTAL